MLFNCRTLTDTQDIVTWSHDERTQGKQNAIPALSGGNSSYGNDQEELGNGLEKVYLLVFYLGEARTMAKKVKMAQKKSDRIRSELYTQITWEGPRHPGIEQPCPNGRLSPKTR